MRFAGFTALALIALFCTLLLALRFVVLPRIESHRADIAALISDELGHPVEIDAIFTGWDGWNPELVVQGLRVRDRAGAGTQPLVELPQVTGVVAWTSLLFADLRLKELTIDRPRLAIRRDVAGRVHVAGLELDPDSTAADTGFTDWLLRQRLIVVHDALITWNDDRRNAPQLVLDDVQFRLESRFGHHRFGLTGTPPPELAAPIDLRGDLSAASFAEWKRADGRIYLRLDYADVAAWGEWLPLPVPVDRGAGAMRVWFEFADGVARDIVADVELAELRTRLAADLPPLDLAHLSGRVTWQLDGARRTFAARGLSFVAPEGVKIAPTDLSLRYARAENGETTDGRVTVNRLELAPLAALAMQLPLPQWLRSDLARYAPRGAITNAEYEWRGSAAEPAAYRAQGRFVDLGSRAHESMPGVTGLSGTFEATEAGGSLRLASRDVTLTMPRVFAEPLGLDTASGRVRWERRGDATTVRLDEIEFANAHAAGTAQGSWKSLPRGPGEIDLLARLTRADARHAHRYVPLVVDSDTRNWLKDSLVQGTVSDARLALKGDLARFPFPAGKAGTFVLAIKGSDATLDYANGWPRITGVDAEVRFEGNRMSVAASRGRILGAAIGATTATIADVSLAEPVLAIAGEASGPTSEFLRFVGESPVHRWTGGFAEGAQASGNGRLGLKFDLDLGRPDATARVAGEFQFADNQLKLPGVPTLSRLGGRLTFTERELGGRDLGFEAFGGPARASMVTDGGTVKVSGNGTADLAAVEREIGTPLAERLRGVTDWQLKLDVTRSFAAWTLESSLRGATVDLPRPLGKAAGESVALRVERRALGGDGRRDALVVDFGPAARMVAHRRLGASGAEVERALVLLGKAAALNAEPDRAGLSVRGDVDAIDIDEWLALEPSASPRAASGGIGSPVLQAIDLEARELVAFGRRYDRMTVSARRSAENWGLRLASPQIEGTAIWEPAGSKLANGKFTAQLVRLALAGTDDARVSAEQARQEPARREGSANPWPELDVTSERFIARSGKDVGRLELAARPEGTDWRVTRFALSNDAGRIDAEGSWRLTGRAQQTRFDVTVEAKDAGAFLTRMGLPGDVKGAPAKLTGQLAWSGAPTDFEYRALSGSFRVNAGAGQFTQIDPGVGKLLGVLSLQALPRRITLDFRDVFSEGFAFDTINGTVRIANGVMHTEDLLLSGPAAKVVLAGDVDLERETQVLSVRVQPSLSTVVSTGAGAAAIMLLAANPLVGAAVGAGTLIAQKIMQDPIEQIFSYEYAVRGSWTEPVVERVSGGRLPRFGESARREEIPR